MRARLATIALRLVILTAVWLLGTATFTLAQETGSQAPATGPQTGTTEAEPQEEPAGPLVVPDVRGLPYVFAKGVLEDAGFAWKVKGKVEGYAVNLVKEQSVKPGTRVVDTGAPTIVLELQKNPDYEERGLPESASPYKGTELLLVSGEEPAPAEASTAPAEPAETEPAETTETAPAETTETAPAETTETAPAETTETAPAETTETAPAESEERPPAFVVAGAPPEPLDEIPLPLRAKHLAARLDGEPRWTAEVEGFWQYQHAWIVTGAKFGWWHGAEALRILIGVDEDLQRRWDVGSEGEQVARAALADVLRLSGR